MPLDPVLKKFIDKAVAEGRTATDIGKSISEAGWGLSHIQEAESYYSSKKKSSQSTSGTESGEFTSRGPVTTSSLGLPQDVVDFSIGQQKKYGLLSETGQPIENVNKGYIWEATEPEEDSYGRVFNAFSEIEAKRKEIEETSASPTYRGPVNERPQYYRPTGFPTSGFGMGMGTAMGAGIPSPYDTRPALSEENRQARIAQLQKEKKEAAQSFIKQSEISYNALLPKAKAYGEEVPDFYDFNGDPSQGIEWVTSKAKEYQKEQLSKLREEAVKEAEKSNWVGRGLNSFVYNFIGAADALGAAINFASQTAVGGKPWEDDYTETELGQFAREGSETVRKGALGEKFLAGYTIDEIQKGVSKNILEGNYEAGLGLLGLESLEMVPQLAAAMAPGGVGLRLLATTSAGDAWARVANDPKYNTAEKIAYAGLLGLAEYYTEKIFSADRDAIRGMFGIVQEKGKKGLGDAMFGRLPKGIRAFVEEGFEESVVDLVTQGLDYAMSGKEFDAYQLADAALLGGTMGGGAFVLSKTPSALGRIPGLQTKIKFDSDIQRIKDILDSKDLSPEERGVLSARLNDLLAESRRTEEQNMMFYQSYSEEDKKRTYELNREVLRLMELHKKTKTDIAKKAITDEIKQKISEIEQIEKNYDSKKGQQVPSQVAQGKELGPVPIEGRSAEEAETSGILQEVEDEEKLAGEKTQALEQEQPDLEPSNFDNVTEETAPTVANTLYDYISNTAEAAFKALGTSRRQAARAADSVANVIKSLTKAGKKVNVKVFYSKASMEDWLGSIGERPEAARGIYVPPSSENKNEVTIGLLAPALVSNTTYHEGLHSILPAVFGEDGIKRLFKVLMNKLSESDALGEYLRDFASSEQYQESEDQWEEFSVELASLIADGSVSISVKKGIIDKFMDAMSEVLGIVGIDVKPSAAQLVNILNDYAQKLGTGAELGEIENMLEGNTEPGPVANAQKIKKPTKYQGIIKTRNSYNLSYVNPTNVVDIEKLIDEIVSEGKTVLFWAGDQLGVGQYKDPFTKKKYDLQGGPSYMLNPENVKRGAVWATGLSAKSLSARIKRDKIDYVFIISGGPLSMMFFNGLVLDMWVDRAQSAFENIDSFKESLGKVIVGKKSEALNDFDSWGELKEGLKNKKTLNKTRNVIKGLAETKTKRGLEFLNQYGLSFENFDGLRDGYFKDNNFDILDITTIYKPTVAIDGQSNHLTYQNVVMGELVGIPNRKVSSRDVMTEDFLSSVTKKGKERRGLPPSQIIKAIAGETGMVQGVSRPRKAKRMKISGIPKFVETLDIRITPATTARVQIRVPDKNKNDIKKLSEKYNKLLTDYSKSGDNSHLRRIDEVASQIMDGAKKRLKDNISRVRGAAIQFGDDYVGIWNKIFEPSLKVKLRITPESNEAAISRELALFAERYNQDGIIIETASEMEQQWINGEIDMPLAYDDKNGFTHFPQLLHNFEKELSDQQLADLSLKLKDEGVSFSMNRDELIVSIFPELEPNQKKLSENEQYRAKERIFNDTFDKVTRSINDILRSNEEITPSIRIAKSIYIGGEETSRKWRSDKGGAPKGKTYDTRTYNRSNFLKAFKEGLSNEEKLIPEFVALRNEEIQLSKQKKKLPPEKQARYDALRKIIQPLAESTFATNKNFYRATRLELNSIAEKYANEVDGAFASTFSIKRPARAAVKTLRWYGAATDELGDGARVNIIVRNEKDADKLFEKLDNDFPAKGKEERRVRQETELGYPKRLLEVRNDLGFIGEIQVMTMNGYLAKDGVSYFNPERKDDARDSLKKVQERIGWNIPDGLGHYFYEINRDENIDDSLRNQALFLSKGYYSAFNDPNFNLEEDYFFAEIADFKKKVDNADKSNWDEGNKGESPISLNRYLRSKGVKVPSKKTKKQIIGDSSKMSSWVKESKFKAVMMEEEGIDSERIYFATGWERGTDKYWRYEVEPIRLTQKGIEDLIDKDDIVSLASLIEARPSNMPRSKDNETLLDFYPQLKDVDVLIAPYGSRTFYSYNEKVIQISKNVVDLGMDEFYLTIVHEVQHAVQHIEGFAVGAGLSSVESQLRSAITDAYDLRMTALAKSESIADDYQMVYEDFLTDKENAEGEEIKDLPNSDSFIAYDKYKTYVEIVNSATFEYNFLEDLLKTRMQPNGKELITDFELYMAFAGEAEARNASRRAKMSKEERRSTPLSRSEDIVRDEQIVQYPGEVTSPKVKRMALTDTFKEATAKALEGVNITTSNDDLFNKIKGSKWNTIPYTLEQIVKKWDELKNVKNDNIDTIKYLIDNPSKTPIVLNSKGDLIDGHHRVVANKISGISKVKYVFDDGSFDINEPFTGNINKNISEAYYKAKADGSNPKLVQDIEDLLGQTAPKAKRMAIVPSESRETPSQIDDRAGELLLELFKGTKYFDRVKSIKRQPIIDPESRKKYEKALKEKDGRALYNILGNQDAEKAIAFAKEKFPIKGSLAAMADRVYLPTNSEEVLNFGSTVIYGEYQKYLNKELKDIVNESTLDPKDLLREVGYELFNPKNLTEARESFLHFYENGQNICTLNIGSNRFQESFVTFIVKDDAAITPMADKLTQDNLTKDWKDYLEKKGRKNADGTYNLNGIGRDSLDPYSTSVVSLQINKSNGVVKEISRYNHQIGSPDNIFSRDFNKIIDGLEDAMFKKFGVNKNINQSRKKIPYGIIQDADGRFFNYISEKNGVYYGDGFYLEGGVATLLDKNSQRMVDGFVINANGKVEDVINSGKPFFYGDVLKVNYIKGNEISLKTVNGDFVFEVTNGAVSSLINFPKAWVEKELDKISSYTYDSEGGIIITYTRFSDDFLERINMLWSDDIVGFNTSMDFSNTKIQFLGKLKYITGNANFSRSNIQSLGELMYIGGNAWFSKSKVQSLGELRYVGSMAIFLESQIQSLGKLRYVGSDIEFAGSTVKSLGELRFVAGYASFFEAQVQSLGKLRYVGSAIDTYDVQSLGELRYVGTTASFPQIQDKSFKELRYVGGYIHLGNLNRIESIGNLSHVGRKTLYSSALNNIQEEINNLVDSRKSIGYGLIGKEEYARVRAEYHQISKKTEELVRGLSQDFKPNSSSTIEKAILEIDEIGDTKPEVKRQALGKNLKRDVSKVSRMSAGSFSGRMYNYLLSLTTEDDQGKRKIAISKTEWMNTMTPIIGANEASDMYDNVLNNKIPQDAIDTSLTSNIDKAYEDSLSKIERETRKAVFTIENLIVKLIDRQHLIKAAILKANIPRVKNLIVNKAGSSSRALHFVRSWENRIYKGLSEDETTLLDKLIVLRRVKAIDDNFAQRYNDALDEYNDAMQQLSNQQPGTPKYDKLLAKAERAQRKMEEAKPPTHPEGINGITASLEMARMRESIGDDAFNNINERASEYFDAFSSILDEMYRENMISEKLYEQLAGLDYQPRVFLEHMFADMDQNMMTEHRLTGPIIKRLKEGSDKEMLFNSRYLFRIYAKNAFSRIARNKIHKELAKYADTQNWISSSPRTGFSEITFYGEKDRKKGVQQNFYLKNDLYNSLNDVFKYAYLSPKAQNIIGMISGARLLKFFATQVNPLFVVKNIPRDFLHILFFTDFYDKSPLPVAAFRLGMDYISGINSKITEDKWFNLYIKYGGGMEFLSTEGEESAGLGYVPNAKKTMMGKLGMKASEVLSKTKEGLGYLGELSEIAPRIGIFKALVERNLRDANVDIRSAAAEPIIEEAVAMVREIIDFAQGGELTKAGESAIPYLNAAFQGFRVASRYAFVSNPKQFAYKLAQLSVAVFALALYNSSVGDDDMEDISDDIKFRNWIILTPFRDKDGNRFYLKIAKTQQLQSFAYLAEIASEAFVASQKDREPRINDDLGDVALKAVGGYLPKDVGKLDKEIATANPFLAAIYTYKSNYDAFRDAVVSRDYALEGKNKVFPQYEDFYDKNVPYFYKAIGQGLGVGPKRLQASTEKMITSPHSSLLVMGGYALADSFSRMFELKGPDGLTLKDQSDISKSVAERFDVDAKKIFLGVTNPETKSYEKREQIDESNMDSNTRRMFIKREADKWGQKLYEMRNQPNANTSANIDTYNKTIDSINAELSSIYDKQGEQTAEYFRNRVFVVAKKGSDIPQEYNDLLFASDDLARAKILYMYDKSMSEQEIYDYMGSYSEAVGRNVSREQNIRIAEEYNKLKK